jgi:hypothetical protein
LEKELGHTIIEADATDEGCGKDASEGEFELLESNDE